MNIQLYNKVNESYTPLEQILTNRGFKLQDIPHYLNLTEADNLSPTLLNNIDNAIHLLMIHLLKEDNEILIIVD